MTTSEMAKYRPVLSRGTASKIRWSDITAGVERLRGASEKAFSGDYAQKVTSVFDKAKLEFRRVLSSLRSQIRITLWIVLPALAVSIAGGAVLAAWKEPVGGAASGVALAALFGFLNRAWRLGRDQAALELIPATYEVVFQLCRSQEQYEVAFEAFLDEMVNMRRKLQPKSSLGEQIGVGRK